MSSYVLCGIQTQAEERVEHTATFIVKSSYVLCGIQTKTAERVKHRASFIIKSSRDICGIQTKAEERHELQKSSMIDCRHRIPSFGISISIIPYYDNSMIFYSRPVAKKWRNRTVCFQNTACLFVETFNDLNTSQINIANVSQALTLRTC